MSGEHAKKELATREKPKSSGKKHEYNTPKSYLGELRKFPKDLKFKVYYNKVMN
jgi:hypothetical protein